MNYQLGEKIILIDPMIPSEEPYKDQSRHYVLDVQITQLEQIA